MASAFLTSRNEPRSSDISKFSNNSNLTFTRLDNITNPNPNPNPNINRDVILKNRDYGYRYITFRLGSYTRRELKELKRRLISDLERVRSLRVWICSKNKNKNKSALKGKQKRCKPSQCGRGKKNAKPKRKNKSVEMRKCGQILGKLMKHKHGWVFNTPVDAAALKLYDYHNIIPNPMDLGTIKSKLAKNEYESPLAFASDVRLTFQNAMAYNGKDSGVFVMAERLLLLFEDMFNPTIQKPVSDLPLMTSKEKSDLAGTLLNLQLGPEGMEQMMKIINKGSLGVDHHGDEIELDLGVLDNDTLWELHRFIASKGILTNKNLEEEIRKEEDIVVDIGDEEIPKTYYPCLEIEKEEASTSDSSSSSSSSSSGNSGSDTTSSS